MQSRLESQRRAFPVNSRDRSEHWSSKLCCVSEPRCDGVTFWGFTDAHSWIDAQFGADDPLLFDDQYAVKPAYFGVLDALWRR